MWALRVGYRPTLIESTAYFGRYVVLSELMGREGDLALELRRSSSKRDRKLAPMELLGLPSYDVVAQSKSSFFSMQKVSGFVGSGFAIH
jgi:hypothetical protein